ncbi:MAG: ATP-binding cassette domain-containing protein [Acidobacteria bacterium]|nr:ATP-binding cassette domain-containing protein [Acidobacteriota bacterium]MDW7984170.1 ATP-binding cassette domain-containing protein [Acidobacteriota bacterium]
MSAALVLENVTKRFGKVTAVSDLSLRVPSGTIYGCLGPNGAGKTTTLRMIVGILLPDEGRVTVLGHTRPEAVRPCIGYLPEERGLYKKMKVAELLAYLARLKGLDSLTARRRVHEWLDRLGLAACSGKPCEALSKGMSQKVQLAAALVHDPELVVLDEPFAGLDPVNQDLLRDIVLDLKRRGRTVLFSTHIMEQAEQICDAVVLIHRGRKVLDGPLADVKAAGGQAIHLAYDGDGHVLWDLAGVRRVNDSGKYAEIFLDDGVDPQAILTQLVGRIRIRRFEVRAPSLHEIFIRAVGGEVRE